MRDGFRKRLYNLSPFLFRVAYKMYRVTPVARSRQKAALESMRRGITAHNTKALELFTVHGVPSDRILAGPFSGMHYQTMSVGSLLSPKIIGSYESQLHSWIQDIGAASYPIIIDLGCAEGYYAVGLARLSQQSQVIASDMDQEALKAVESLSKLNGVKDRIKTIGRLDHSRLNELLQPSSLVFADIEGGERELLDPSKVPVLQYCDLIVEMHEAQVPGVMHNIVGRFVSTHKIEAVWAEPIRSRLRLLADLGTLSEVTESDQLELIAEGRPHDQCWLRMLAHSRRGP